MKCMAGEGVASRCSRLVEGAAVVPSEAHEDRAAALLLHPRQELGLQGLELVSVHHFGMFKRE